MHAKDRTREGSALLIVLGFLAVLLLLVFAFAVKMQTEYRMARNAESSVRTDFVMVQGIHLTALEAGHPRISPSRSYWFYPRREMINGAGVLVGDDAAATIDDFLSWPADLFIPRAIYPIAMIEGMTNRLGILPTFFGGPVHDYYAACGEYERYVATSFEPSGVAYVMLNNSGYLDIHTTYGTMPRKYGRDIRELQLTDVIAAPAALPGGRSLHGRIESMMELYAYRNDFGLASDADLALFTPYSSAVQGQYWNTNKDTLVNAVCITGDVSSIELNATEIKNAFAAAGFNQSVTIGPIVVQPAEVQGWLVTNLLEYLDTDHAPRGLVQPCQEAIPGLNEVAINSLYQCTLASVSPTTTYQYRVSLSMELELWRPHVTPTPLTIDCRLQIGRVGARMVPVAGPPFAAAGNTLAFNAAAVVSTRAPTVMAPAFSNQFAAVQSSSYITQVIYNLIIPAGLLLKDATANNLDMVAGPITITITNNIPPNGAPTAVGQTVANSPADRVVCIEAIDPRLNWDFASGAYWTRTDGINTIGHTNVATLTYLTNGVNNTDYVRGDDIDRASYAFCADRLPLDTIGELGYLVVAPWRTVRLYQGARPDQKVEPVVDTFTLDKPGSRARGLVSLNTCFTGALQAAFSGACVDLYPGAVTTNAVTPQQARRIGAAILQYTYGTPYSQTAVALPNGLNRGMLNVSSLGEVTNIFADTTLMSDMSVDCEFLREAIVRNNVGLLTTRNVNYTAVLCASDEIDGGGSTDFNIRNASRMGSEHKAIAMICRDPWSKETFVRHFRYLPNDGVLNQY